APNPSIEQGSSSLRPVPLRRAGRLGVAVRNLALWRMLRCPPTAAMGQFRIQALHIKSVLPARPDRHDIAGAVLALARLDQRADAAPRGAPPLGVLFRPGGSRLRL